MKKVQRTLIAVSFAVGALIAQPVDFVKTIEPIFAAKCYACHGPSKQTSGLRLDDRAAALAGGYGGKVIIPGNGTDSILIQRISAAKGLMAMPFGSKGLPAEQAALIKSWIDQGASYRSEEHTSELQSQ